MSISHKNFTLDALIQVFWSYVDKSPGQGPKSKCWEWIGAKDKDGYGICTTTGRKICGETKPHRIVFKLTYPKRSIIGLQVCHHCDNPPCCRPSHLFRGTNSANMKDCVSKGRWVNNNVKLTAKQVVKIKQLIHKGLSAKSIARKFSVTDVAIGHIKNGKTWLHIN